MYSFLIYILIITSIFILYAELSVGNIIYRIDSSGLRVLQLKNSFYYLINPLYNSFLWNIKLLDVNYIFVLTISTIIYHNYINNYLTSNYNNP